MRALRRNILAVPQHPLGIMADPHALRKMHDPHSPAQPPIPDGQRPRSLTISLMLSAPDRVDQAGHPNNHRKARSDEKHPEEA